MNERSRVFAAAGSFLLAGSLLFAAPALANGNDESSDGQDGQDAPGIDMTNARIIEALDDSGRCLFRNGVFPEGGVGYEDLSLPYDDYPENERAAEVYRAELLRAHPDSLAGVAILRGLEGEIRGIDVSVTIGGPLDAALSASPLDPAALLGTITDSRPLQEAIAALDALGIPRNVEVSGVVSLLEACVVQEEVFDGGPSQAAGLPEDLGVETVADQVTGQLVVTVPAAYADAYQEALSEFGDAYQVTPTDSLINFQGRQNLNSPRRGGSLIANAAGAGCSTAYRINTSGVPLPYPDSIVPGAQRL